MWAALLAALKLLAAALGLGKQVAANLHDTAERDAGAEAAARETADTTTEIADARAQLDARPDDPAAVAERLRAKARAAGGGVGGRA